MQAGFHSTYFSANDLRDFFQRDALVLKKNQSLLLEVWEASNCRRHGRRHFERSARIGRKQFFRAVHRLLGAIVAVLLQRQVAGNGKQVHSHTSPRWIVALWGTN